MIKTTLLLLLASCVRLARRILCPKLKEAEEKIDEAGRKNKGWKHTEPRGNTGAGNGRDRGSYEELPGFCKEIPEPEIPDEELFE